MAIMVHRDVRVQKENKKTEANHGEQACLTKTRIFDISVSRCDF